MTIILRNITKTYLTEEGQRLVFKNTGCTLPSGKNIAIMGDNGSGKSTFLRLVGQATYPDKGKIITDERISWPVGFRGCLQMSLTPKENIVFVCMLMQRDKIQTKKIIDFVEDFSEMGEYFNLPIKKFSTGMRARLAFSISMAFDFDCYLIDEVTNTGDTNFKVKAQEALLKKSETGRLIIVSHALKKSKKILQYGSYC